MADDAATADGVPAAAAASKATEAAAAAAAAAWLTRPAGERTSTHPGSATSTPATCASSASYASLVMLGAGASR